MLTSLVAISLLTKLDTPEGDMIHVIDRYHGLTTFTATLHQHESSGMYGGDFGESLRWRKGGQFELLVTRPAKQVPANSRMAPDFFASGGKVQAIAAGSPPKLSSIKPEANFSPAWEVLGGPVMSFLQQTPTEELYLGKNPGAHIRYSYGTRTTWQGEEVKEIIADVKIGDFSQRVSLLLSPNNSRFVGYEWSHDNKIGFTHYTKQEFNPQLPAELGKHRKG